ncbi:MAG: protein translocase subunit SecF [Patescibacteria group bacterium]
MFRLIRNAKIWFIVSALGILLSLAAILTLGLRVGIDYRGGTVIELESNNTARLAGISDVLKERGYNNPQIKESGGNKVILRLPHLSNEEHTSLSAALTEKIPDLREVRYDTVGPTIGRDLTNRSIIAVVLASLGIIFYIAYAFRKLPRPLSSWIFGLSAIVALIHDLLITTGIVAILGYFFHWMEVDALFITALLTIMGFSVHDTIVVYDRLRENFLKNPHRAIGLSAEESVNQTLVRSINTSLTVILVLLTLIILGSESIRHFTLTLAVGVFIGTYSSVFVASPLVVIWHKRKAMPQKARSRRLAAA